MCWMLKDSAWSSSLHTWKILGKCTRFLVNRLLRWKWWILDLHYGNYKWAEVEWDIWCPRRDVLDGMSDCPRRDIMSRLGRPRWDVPSGTSYVLFYFCPFVGNVSHPMGSMYWWVTYCFSYKSHRFRVLVYWWVSRASSVVNKHNPAVNNGALMGYCK